MIVLDAPKLKFLLRGRTVTVTVHHDRFRRGRTYAVGTAHNKPASCSATIVGIKVTASGRELEIVQNREAPERYLARSVARNYTTRPEEAIPDEGATALTREDLKHIAAAGLRRYERERRNEIVLKQAWSISVKVREAAKRNDRETVLKLRKELTALAKQMEAA